MFKRLICFVLLVAGAVALSSLGAARAADDGIVKLRSAYPMPETIARMKKDIADKGIKFFDEIDQAKLAADAGITLLPSTLLVFGNPPLGTLFITADPDSGLDWPVRVLVYQDAKGDVWVAYTDFEWIRKRHGIANRGQGIQDGVGGHRLDHLDGEGELGREPINTSQGPAKVRSGAVSGLPSRKAAIPGCAMNGHFRFRSSPSGRAVLGRLRV